MVTSALFLTIFFGALVSGWHCALMCGGIAAGLERVKKDPPSQKVEGVEVTNIVATVELVPKARLIYQQFLTHLGRISTYVLLGSLAGVLGLPLWQQGWLPVQRALFALAALIFLFQAYRVLTQSKAKTSTWEVWLNTKTVKLWSKITQLLQKKGSRPHFLVGMIWGLVPAVGIFVRRWVLWGLVDAGIWLGDSSESFINIWIFSQISQLGASSLGALLGSSLDGLDRSDWFVPCLDLTRCTFKRRFLHWLNFELQCLPSWLKK
jgi:sulfite exporter TauE/SafE